ncbi:MAG: glycosyltransferase [Gammaproteobacteria bacterium]|jgi:exo-beta-1,3-glucanase (GH17 family)/cellulose synthase/poly-beta-1,6-N-acetylglucosamine synthase-like glycosyltransferase
MRRIFCIFLIVAATFAVWEATNQPLDEPLWSGQIDGFAYSPMRPGQSPEHLEFPSIPEIEADIAVIAAHSSSLRTYSLDGTLARIPAIAARHGIEVTAGVWLDADLNANRARLARLERLVAENANVERVIIGNETLLTGALTAEALSAYLSMMRERLSVPVSTAEPWHIWLANPDLADSVDFVTVHLLPYWEGVPSGSAVSLVTARMRDLAEQFPEQSIMIGEVGWPSKGRSRDAASASRQDAETFLRQFLSVAGPLGYDYFLMEAFDQPWKQTEEGEVGAYWGLFDGARRAKYAFDQVLRPIPERRSLAALAALVAIASFLLLAADSARMRGPGLGLLATAAFATGNVIVWTLNDYLQQYWSFGDVIAAAVMMLGLIGIVVLVFIEVHEWAEAGFKRCARSAAATPPIASHPLPKVSIHVPAYEEPPAMMIETLNALARLDYPNFEVLVIDNNTRNEALWRPVEAHCARLGERFHFYHVTPLPGFKAGALNYALTRTCADAEIIAVIDSDYVVATDWLKRLVPHFADQQIALVQAPQDYRDHGTRALKRICEAEYRGFFRIGMVTRNERNAIIQHGTMTMIRARVLCEIDGWSEWTITEDAELGLRIFERGYQAIYTMDSHGRGLTPDRFRDYRSQRYRWALGATQILRKHARMLLGLQASELSLGQRFHFLTGWAAWLGDGLNLLFNLIAIVWSALMITSPLQFLAPDARFSGLVLAFFAFKLVKMAWLYNFRVRASVIETISAIVAGLSLVFITGRAVLAGFAGSDAPFVRTPKHASEDSIFGELQCVASEILLAVALLGMALAVTVTAPFDSVDRRLWTLLLVVFAIPHLAAVALAWLSALPQRTEQRPELESGEALRQARKA